LFGFNLSAGRRICLKSRNVHLFLRNIYSTNADELYQTVSLRGSEDRLVGQDHKNRELSFKHGIIISGYKGDIYRITEKQPESNPNGCQTAKGSK